MLHSGERPYAIWSDNGTEFKGDFDTFLQNEHVRHVLTTPYNPEQNGKIERFWPTVEKWDDDGGLMDWIEGYNATAHTALPRMTQPSGVRVRMSPNDAYAMKPHWVPGTVPLWIVDGQCKTFPESHDAADQMPVPVPPATLPEAAAPTDTTFSEEDFEEPELECEREPEDETLDAFWELPKAEWEVDGTLCFFGSTNPVQTVTSCSLVIGWEI
jgi:hypothetical protein